MDNEDISLFADQVSNKLYKFLRLWCIKKIFSGLVCFSGLDCLGRCFGAIFFGIATSLLQRQRYLLAVGNRCMSCFQCIDLGVRKLLI